MIVRVLTFADTSPRHARDFMALVTNEELIDKKTHVSGGRGDLAQAKILFERKLFNSSASLLNAGFSLSMWVLFNSIPKNDETSILSIQKNVTNAPLRLTLSKGKLALHLRNDKGTQLSYSSEKELKTRRYYNIVVSCGSEGNNLHGVSIFVNGFMDIQGSVQFYSPFTNAQIVVGEHC